LLPAGSSTLPKLLIDPMSLFSPGLKSPGPFC
jgi:hypothetical protein